MGTDVVKNVNKNNASHAVLFEALALVSAKCSSSFTNTIIIAVFWIFLHSYELNYFSDF
jgi:hypothetical protein